MLVPICFVSCVLLSFLDMSGSARISAYEHGVEGRKPTFTDKSPGFYLAKKGEIVRLKCNVFGWQPSWRMTWYKNGKLIERNKEIRLRVPNVMKSSFLKILAVRKEDTGMYKCVASNKYGSVSKELNLTVIGKVPGHGEGPPWFLKPYIYNMQQFIAWPAWKDSKLRCAADGEPPLKYQWLKDGKVLKYRRLDPTLNVSKWFLRINTAIPSDNGLYTCVVSNRLGSISQKFKFHVIEKASIRPLLSTQFPVNKTAKVGENVTFQCVELFSPLITDYRWLHWRKFPPTYPNLELNDKAPSLNSSYYTLIHPIHYKPFKHIEKGKYGGRVLLTNVTKEDEGMYTCLISNHIGQDYRSAFVEIVTSESSQSSMETYKMKTRLENAFDDSRKMACSVSVATNQPMKKTKNAMGLKRLTLPHQFTITLESVKPKDNETYTCNVSNKQGSINMTYEIYEQGECGPVLNDFQDVTANEGDNVTLTCKAYNRNKPKLIWFAIDHTKKQYNMVQHGKHTELKPVRSPKEDWQGERLRLLNVTPDDSKRYLCLGINVVSSRTQSVFVKVLPKKKIQAK